MRALIGHTGFVGGNLARQSEFGASFNSKNSKDMRGQNFDEIFCAGVSAIKWQANKDPKADREAITALENNLREVKADRFVLISTIDVYPFTNRGDEQTNLRGLSNHAYGTHRLAFEDFCRSQFHECFVVRLPGLFGTGLRKNIIYDLLNDNCLEMINPRSSFQYYNLDNLTNDIERVVRQDVRLINLFPEPISTQEILDKFFEDKAVGTKAGQDVHYNIGTAYANLWDRHDRYCAGKETMLDQMENFISKAKEPHRVA